MPGYRAGSELWSRRPVGPRPAIVRRCGACVAEALLDKDRTMGLKEYRKKLSELLAPGKFFLPDAVTSLGLLIGFYSLVFALSGHFVRAAVMTEIALLCDGLDGLIARTTHASSRVGIEYDSLSDVITFGVAPASLMFMWSLKPLGAFGVAICGLFVVCAALRLARFNIQSASVGKSRFVGLPVPAAAAMIAGLLLADNYLQLNWSPTTRLLMAPLVPVLAFMMISRIPYPSFKAIDFKRHASIGTTVGTLVFLGLLAAIPQLMALLAAVAYVFSGPILMAMGERTEATVPGFWTTGG